MLLGLLATTGTLVLLFSSAARSPDMIRGITIALHRCLVCNKGSDFSEIPKRSLLMQFFPY
jgi:hypothetical protein